MSNPNGYLTRSMLDELDKKKEKKTTTPIIDNWQRLTVSQQEKQKQYASAARAESVAQQSKKATSNATTAKSSQQNSLGAYNAASVLSLGKGPLSAAGVDQLVASGEATATSKNGQTYVSPKPSTTSTASKTTKSDHHDVYYQVKETASTSKPKSTQNTTTVSRGSLALSGGAQNTMAKYVNLGGLVSEAAAPGNRRIQESRAKTGDAFGDGFWGTAARLLINNPPSGNASTDALRNSLTSIDDTYVPRLYEIASALSRRGTQNVTQAKEGLGSAEQAVVDFAASIPELAAELSANALLPGAGTALRGLGAAGQASLDYRQKAGESYDTGNALLRAGLAGGGVAVGDALSKGVGSLGNNALQNIGLGTRIVPNSIKSGLGASAYTMGEVGGDELGRTLTEQNYAPDWNRIGSSSASAFAFSALNDLVQNAFISQRNKAHIQQDLDDVRQQYNETIKALADSTATPEQRAALAQSTIDNANWASGRIDELIPNGGYEARSMQDALGSIVEEMKPYTSKGLQNFEESNNIYLQGDPFYIGRSVGSRAKNYSIIDKETGIEYHFVEGTRVENPTVFAGYKGTKPLNSSTVNGLVSEYGGNADKWQHSKGIGTLDVNGDEIKAEIHWFQEESVGKVKFKVKRWLE